MNRWYLILLLILSMRFRGVSQPYDTIKLGFSTSVHLIFDSPVQKWDMGLGTRMENDREVRDVLVETTFESPERIKLGAGIERFQTTNLFVETLKAYYNFIIAYEEHPDRLLIHIPEDRASILKKEVHEPGIATKEQKADSLPDADTVVLMAEKIGGLDRGITDIGKVSQKMLFYIGGIYISGNYLFFKIFIKNSGNIPYDIGFVGFFRCDKKGKSNKKQPMQEQLLEPLFVTNDQKTVVASDEVIAKVFAFRKFTLDRTQKLSLQFWEGNQGERKIELSLTGKDILKAKKL